MTTFFAAAWAMAKTVPTVIYWLALAFLLGNLSCHAWHTRHHIFTPAPVVQSDK